MISIFVSVFKALGQIADPRFRKILWRSVILACILLFAVSAVITWLVGLVFFEMEIPFIGQIGWLSRFLQFGSYIAATIVSFFLVVPLAATLMSLFLDNVIEVVEQRHYPHSPPHTPVSLAAALMDSLRFLWLFCVANLVAFALYLLLPPLAVPIFLALNGFLLGQEYFTLVAMRRMGRKGAYEVARRHRVTIWTAGILMAIPLFIPLLGLVMPILGAATFTHLFHELANSGKKAATP